MGREAGLKDESLVPVVAGKERGAVIDQEDGDRACSVGDHPLGDPQRFDRADRDGHTQALAARDVLFDSLGGFLG